jgi:EAL domain-containing protein (putative c-di-GMP-specific phosphodiesterase class I)
MMQPTLKMSHAKVRRLLAVTGDLEESDICRRETVPAISCVRVRANVNANPSTATTAPAIRVRDLNLQAASATSSASAPITVRNPLAAATSIAPEPIKIADFDVRVELEPVFDANELRVIGQEARIIHTPTIGERERHREEMIRRRGRELAVKKFLESPQRSKLFIDVLPIDLLDPELYEEGSPLARIADKVVLQLRGRLGEVMIEDLRARISVLRFQGFRIAIADVDSAPARLSLIAEVAPEFLKIDASLIRGIHRSDAKKRIVTGLTTMCRLLGTMPIAEGVTTAEERAALFEAGCHVVQGPLHTNEDDYALPVVRKGPPLRAVAGGMRRR